VATDRPAIRASRAGGCPGGLVCSGLPTQDDAVSQAALAAYDPVVDDGVGPQNEGLPGCEERFWFFGQQADAHDGVDWTSVRR